MTETNGDKNEHGSAKIDEVTQSIQPDKSVKCIPECLTIDLGPQCNLSCCYCFAKDKPHTDTTSVTYSNNPDFLNTISSAAELITRNARHQNKTFYFGFQGDGEPLLQFNLVQKIYHTCIDSCKKQGISAFSFITSNGTMAPDVYEWIAHHFNRICISVDGPSFVHDSQRPYLDGNPTLPVVIKSLKLLRDYGSEPVCRVTVMPSHVSDIPVIVQFLSADLHFKSIQIEPVYHLVSIDHSFPVTEFVDGLLQARKIAKQHNVEILYSGYRRYEEHGPYCNVLKKVLHINSSGKVSNCAFGKGKPLHQFIGEYDKHSEKFLLHADSINILQEKLVALLNNNCRNCPVFKHCTRGCPDFCILETFGNDIPASDTLMNSIPRCRINRLLYEKNW